MKSIFPKESRQQRISEHRRNKPLAELERKWLKARGRHSNQFWFVEWLDYAHGKAVEMVKFLRKNL